METIKVGEVISFRLSDNMLVTHRVIAVTDGAYTTKGDANNIADAAPVTAENYIGKTVFVIPKLGVLLVLLHTAGGKIAAAALILLLLILSFLPGKDTPPDIQKGGDDVLLDYSSTYYPQFYLQLCFLHPEQTKEQQDLYICRLYL